MPSGGKHLHGHIPETAVDSHVLRNGRDRTGPHEPPSSSSTHQAPTKEILLNSICYPPQIVPDVLHSSAGKNLCRFNPALGSLRESQLQCALRKLKLLILRQAPVLHVLNLRSQGFESFGHLQCADHDLLHDIASVTHALG